VAAETEALRGLVAKLDGGGGAAVSLAPTLAALAERRVQTLVLAPHWDDSGGRCPSCGLLYAPDTGPCPVDGSELAALTSLRPAVVRAALEQDAEVVRLDDLDERAELQAFGGIGALLRY
jgi:peptide subunit release factor 1 (eRF1)